MVVKGYRKKRKNPKTYTYRGGRKKLSVEEYRENLVQRHGQRFLDDMDKIFSGEINVTQISKNVGLTQVRVYRIFERLYGKTIRQVMKDGFAKDSSGAIWDYDGDYKRFSVMLPSDLHARLEDHSKKTGLSMSQIIRDCLADLFYKDGMSKLMHFLK